MTGTEVNLGSAWAERTFATLVLPFTFLVMAGGGAALLWLGQQYPGQFWIILCVIAVLAVLGSHAWSVTSRHHRRRQWLAQRAASAGDDSTDVNATKHRSMAELETADSRELMREMLSRIDVMQRHLEVLMGEFTSEHQRGGSGRHAGPVTVDIRDDFDMTDDDEDFDELDDLNDFGDLPDFDELDDDPDALDELDDISLGDDKQAGPSGSRPDPAGPDDVMQTPPGNENSPGEDDGVADTSAENRPAPERRMRRLVRDRTPGQQYDPIPAPREPVQVIELPRDDHRDMETDDDDYFGSDFDDIDESGPSGTDPGPGDTDDEGDDDERPRNARS